MNQEHSFTKKQISLSNYLKYWETYLVSLGTKIKGMNDAVWSGDGRFDSIGHSAKFGVYTLLCSPIMKIVHSELL